MNADKGKVFFAWSLAMLVAAGCSTKPAVVERPREVVPPQVAPTPELGQVVVKLKPSDVTRPGAFRMMDGSWDPPPPEKLSRGELKVGSEHITIYVPTYGPYSTQSAEHHSYSNTSTAISVDSDNNGQADPSEKWYTSLPVRLGDEMYEVKKFDPGGTWLLLEKSPTPLSGCVIGRKCPDFEFTTMEGKKVSLDTYKGKVLLLDVWSMT